ncbi:MAG: UxaA family hydrolase [Candidatus Dormibacteria bacterium]
MSWQASGYDHGARGIGIRDVVLVVPSVGCSNRAVELAGRANPNLRVITHQHGCGQLGDDRTMTPEVLARTCCNPNVRASVVVGLGCETNQAAVLATRMRTLGGSVEHTLIQEAGSIGGTVERVGQLALQVSGTKPKRVPLLSSDLVIGLLHDRESGAGGAAVCEALRRLLEEVGSRVLEAELSIEPLPGSASESVPGAWPGEHRIPQLAELRAFSVGNDTEALSLLVAQGAHLVVFVTGRGNPVGSAVAPTLKVSNNPALRSLLVSVVDMEIESAGDPVVAAEAILVLLLDTAGGRPTAAEMAGQHDFGIPRLAPSM